MEEIKNYVQNNGKLLELSGSGGMNEVTWDCSKTSNLFEHEISSSYYKGPIERVTSDIRVPLYCTVPVGSEGDHKWIGELDGVQTSTSMPVEIKASLFSVESDGTDFELREIKEMDKSVLRVLMYKPGRMPNNQKI